MSEKDAPSIDGAVFYADGGAKPNPGPAGFGIFGYHYSHTLGKRGTGLSTHVLTNAGFVFKTPKDTELAEAVASGEKVVLESDGAVYTIDQVAPSATERTYTDGEGITRQSDIFIVQPVAYVSGLASFTGPTSTNNLAELSAVLGVLRHCIEHKIPVINIYADSRYVVNGITDPRYMQTWKHNGWKREDGAQIKNMDVWQLVADAMDTLVLAGAVVTVAWIRSHSGFLGNVIADELATIGRTYGKNNTQINHLTEHPVDGYWKKTHEKHPLLNYRHVYFSTNKNQIKSGQYYIGGHGEDADYGVPLTSSSFGIVFLDKDDPYIEVVRNTHADRDMPAECIAHIRLDELYRDRMVNYLQTYGRNALILPEPNSQHIFTPGGEALCSDFRPIPLAYKGYLVFEMMHSVYNDYLKSAPHQCVTDITSHFYKTDDKGKQSLREEMVVGTPSIKAVIRAPIAAGDVEADLVLTLDSDLPDRNSLKRLETRSPVIYAVTWPESPTFYRLAIVIKCADGHGIWCNPYTNMRPIKLA